MKQNALFLLPLFALALSSCSTVSDGWDGVFGEDGRPLGAKSSACPQVAVVRDLSVYQNPPAADETTLVYSARMGNVRGSCRLDHRGLTVEATADIVAMRGSRGAAGNVSLPYFVSVLDAQDNVLTKSRGEAVIEFDNSSNAVRVSFPIEPRVDLKSGQDGATYRVLLGFELTASQVDANTRYFSQTSMSR